MGDRKNVEWRKLIRFLKREIEGVGGQELRDGRSSSPDIPLKEDLV